MVQLPLPIAFDPAPPLPDRTCSWCEGWGRVRRPRDEDGVVELHPYTGPMECIGGVLVASAGGIISWVHESEMCPECSGSGVCDWMPGDPGSQADALVVATVIEAGGDPPLDAVSRAFDAWARGS